MTARSPAKRVAILAFGWVFVLLGIVGLFLPFLQGILFLLIGLYLLSRESERARRIHDLLRRRYPALAEKADAARDWMKRQWRRALRR